MDTMLWLQESDLVVFNHSAGHSECGFVLQFHLINEFSDWQTFYNDSAANDRYSYRFDAPINLFFGSVFEELTTVISIITITN